MDIRILRYFLAVAREESISHAAKALHVSQPTLSRQLADLETELGTTLFIRGNRRISLTEEGHFLVKKAKEIVALVDKTEANFKQPIGSVTGEITIGAGETEAMGLIGRSLHSLLTEHPGIRFHLYSGNADDLMEKLDSGVLDFGLVIEPTNKEKYEYLHLPAVDTWGVLMRRDSPLASLDTITPEDLADRPLILSRQTTVDNELTGWFGRDIGDLTIVGTYNLLYNASLMVKEGLGYAVCLEKIIPTPEDGELVFRPLNPGLHAGLNLIWKKHGMHSAAANAFLDHTRRTIHAKKEDPEG